MITFDFEFHHISEVVISFKDRQQDNLSFGFVRFFVPRNDG